MQLWDGGGPQAGSECLLASLTEALLGAIWHRTGVQSNGRGCYGAGETLQCPLLPKKGVVAKENVAKAKGSTRASEHR